MKVSNIFKVLITVFILITFTASVISCKEVPAVVEEQPAEEEKPAVEVSNETKEETKKETPPVVEEETPEEIEWEGLKITPIEGLRFEEGNFFAEAGNPYGLEVGEKAGVCITDGPEVNGQTTWFGFNKEVLEVMQKKIMEEEKRFVYPFPIDLEQAKGMKIKEAEVFGKNTRLEISNVPLGTIIYAPSSTLMICGEDVANMQGGSAWFAFEIVPNLFKEQIINNTKVDFSGISIIFNPKGVGYVSQEIEKEFTQWKKDVKSNPYLEPLKIETKMGTPLGKIIDRINLIEQKLKQDPKNEDIWYVVGLKQTDFQIEMYLEFIHTDEGNGDNFKAWKTGLKNLLEIGEMKVFILSAYD